MRVRSFHHLRAVYYPIIGRMLIEGTFSDGNRALYDCDASQLLENAEPLERDSSRASGTR